MFFDPLVLLFTISSAKFGYVVHISFKINEAQTIYETPKTFLSIFDIARRKGV